MFTIPPPCLLSLHILRPAGLLLPLFLPQDTVNALSDFLGFFHFRRMASLSAKALAAEIESLLSEKNAGYTECQKKKWRVNELLTIKRSIGWVLHAAPSFLFPSAPLSCAVWAALAAGRMCYPVPPFLRPVRGLWRRSGRSMRPVCGGCVRSVRFLQGRSGTVPRSAEWCPGSSFSKSPISGIYPGI